MNRQSDASLLEDYEVCICNGRPVSKKCSEKVLVYHGPESQASGVTLKYLFLTEEHWRCVIMMDECYVWLSDIIGTEFLKQAVSDKYLDDCIIPTSSKKNSVMIRGTICGTS